MCPGVGPEGWLRSSAHPLGGVVCRGHAQYPAFAPATLLPALQNGSWSFWSFCILLSIICPNCECMQLFLVPYSFFVFCCSRRHLSMQKLCSKGSQVPGLRVTHHATSEGQLGLTDHRKVKVLWIDEERGEFLCPYSLFVYTLNFKSVKKNLSLTLLSPL